MPKTIRDLPDFTFDHAEHSKLWLDTPSAPPGDMQHRLNLREGTCVKMRVTGHEFPWICGKVQKNTREECVVVGHGWTDDDGEKFVWRGPKVQFELTWRID